MADYEDHLVDDLFPSREIHLVAGSSGAGKTRWLLSTLLDWQQAKPIYGRASHPQPWIYLINDRTLASCLRTLDKMAIPHQQVPKFPLVDMYKQFAECQKNCENIDDVLEVVMRKQPQVRVIVIENIASFCPNPNDRNIVGRFLKGILSRWCIEHNLTIFGVRESPKMKPKEQYKNPRERVADSGQWVYHADTIILIERVNVQDSDDSRRIVTLAPRNEPEQRIEMDFDHGRLVATMPNGPDSGLMDQLAHSKKEFTTAEAEEFGNLNNVNPRTARRWLTQGVACGKLRRVRHGVYAVAIHLAHSSVVM